MVQVFSYWCNTNTAKYEIQKPSTWRVTLFRWKFGLMFPVFHFAWSSCCATKTFVVGWRKLLRKVEHGSTLSNKFWLCCSFFIKLTTCRAANVLVYWQINQSARCISLTHNKCFCCGSSWSRWKTRNIDQNLQRNNVAWQVEGFCISYFAAYTHHWNDDTVAFS